MAKATARLRETNDFPSAGQGRGEHQDTGFFRYEVQIDTEHTESFGDTVVSAVTYYNRIVSFRIFACRNLTDNRNDSVFFNILTSADGVFNSRMMTCTPNGISSPTIKAAASMEERAGDTGE